MPLLREVFSLFTDAVGRISVPELLNMLRDMDLLEGSYASTPYDEALPDFDYGYSFVGATDDNDSVIVDVLEKDTKILQAGFQVMFPFRLFSSRGRKAKRTLANQAELYYGPGVPMPMGRVKIVNYGDLRTICYISTMRTSTGDYVLTLRIGNREFWG